MKKIILSVNFGECTLEEFIQMNKDSLEESDFNKIKSLQINETIFLNHNLEIKRIE